MYRRLTRGFSLVELIIVAAVTAIFFGGLFLTIQNSLRLVTDSRARLSALSVTNDTMEYIRSLSYDAVGTVSGLPPGLIPQVSTTTLNGFFFTKTVLIEYVDDPADGVGGADSNAITTDYKRAKVTVSWVNQQGDSREVFLVTNIVPRSIETSVGGGTIRVNVRDAAIALLPGALVRVVNTTGTTTIDVTKSTDATGVALFGGAPAGAGYEVFVTAPGYSTDQTYQATGTLANPATPPSAVAEAGITTLNFFIDRLAGLSLRVLTDQVFGKTSYAFTSSSDIASSTNVAIGSGVVQLAGLAPYPASGVAQLTAITPSPVARWQSVAVAATTTSGTGYKIRFYSSSTPPTLIPDTVLPGNAIGFTTSPIDISMVSSFDYPTLVPMVELMTSNSAVTPMIDTIEILFVESETALASVPVAVVGAKTIGTRSDAIPVYKTTRTVTTNSNGIASYSDMEWDTYTATIAGYDIAEACAAHPMVVSPGATTSVSLLVTSDTVNSLRVVVVDGSGVPIPDATVDLIHGGTTSHLTSPCGQTFFDGLTAASDYQLQVSAPGYSTVTVDPLDISGDVVEMVTL